MSRILHLSDLHLGNSVDEDKVGDYKIEAINESDRVTRVSLLKGTLKVLGNRLRARGEILDALVVTGDITTQGRPDGFDKLAGVLGELGDVLPPADHIVVVPGNHDVAWGTDPGSRERYAEFIDRVRAVGYVTPLLDGVDYEGDARKAAARAPIVEGDDFVLVAVDSADMCGVIEPFAADSQTQLDALAAAGAVSPELLADIRRVRTYDMPRLSMRQMQALGEELERYKSSSKVVIAGMHHQLLPVDSQEEAKPFESFANLGAVMAFLGAAHVDVVLHGHKHVSGLQQMPLQGDDGTYLAQVASCGTIGGMLGAGHEIAKLIEVDSTLPTLRRVSISSILTPTPGTSRLADHSLKDLGTVQVRRKNSGSQLTITGATATDVHEQLLELADTSTHPEGEPLACCIDIGPSALQAPETYPWPEDFDEDGAKWFTEIVGWWQNSQFAPGKPFTHGQRLRNFGVGIDQIDSVVEALRRKAGTSRAVAVLINPETDTSKPAEFPSFSLVQFTIRGGRLHCTAYFRKQEMRYWWPINVAELAALQDEVLGMLGDEGVAAGSIRTSTSMSVFSRKLPKVNVPKVDREAWDHEDGLRALTLAVIDADVPNRQVKLDLLRRYLFEWIPASTVPPTDGAAVPVHGLKVIADFLDSAAKLYPENSTVYELADELAQMDDANQKYVKDRLDDASNSAQAYKSWLDKMRRRRPRVEALLDRLCPPEIKRK